jgi:hypothetical protein
MKNFLILFLCTALSAGAAAQQMTVSTGRLVQHTSFPSKFVTARNVTVWLPDDYTPEKKYAVVYMHDGQMLFDSTMTWNRSEWRVDEVFGGLLRDKAIRDCIVVGIWNVPAQRFADYFPQKAFESIPEPLRTAVLTQQLKGSPNADNYLRFVVSELKPFIDRTYATRKNRDNTFLMGSSMGGLISLYGICEYPRVFGGAACLSIHSPLISFELMNEPGVEVVPQKFREYLLDHLPKPRGHKIYMDYGDQTLDQYYKPFQAGIDAVMRQRKFGPANWQTRFFPGEGHTEAAWAKRLDVPIGFLMKSR